MEKLFDNIVPNNPIIVTNEEHRFLTSEQLKEVNIESRNIILEPEGRNTAPALTLAALDSISHGEDPVLVVSPADQVIHNAKQFKRAIARAVELAQSDNIVILGVPPNSPETGYGYINIGDNKNEGELSSL